MGYSTSQWSTDASVWGGGGDFPTSLVLLVVIGVAVHDAVGVVSPGLVLHGLGEPLALGVGMVPEVQEQQQEDESVEANDVDEDRKLVGAVLQKEILPDVCGHHHKLYLKRGEGGDMSMSLLNKDPSQTAEPPCSTIAYQLDGRQVLLPPQVLLEARAQGGQAVVSVHDDVHYAVEQCVERSQTTYGTQVKRGSKNGHFLVLNLEKG